VAVVGGLLFSQIITLYITPVVYTYLDAWQKRLARRRATEPREYPEPGTGEARAAGAAG
jgi:HAE1 family hydrophobic/amphiphilic exporter-1